MPIPVKKLPPLSVLRERYIYDPETGKITCRTKFNYRVKVGEEPGYQCKTDGYRRFMVEGARVLAHRIAWYLHTGEDPGEMEVDHINRDRSDNRFCNLRLVDRTQQSYNFTPHRKRHHGLPPHVHPAPDGRGGYQEGRYRVNIRYRGKNLQAKGTFTLEEATEFADLVRQEAHGEYRFDGRVG